MRNQNKDMARLRTELDNREQKSHDDDHIASNDDTL
jgi:hypothetical protein